MSAERDLYDLVMAARNLAEDIAALIRGPMTDEARSLLAQGFLVPSAPSLKHAASEFSRVAAMPGTQLAIRMEDSPSQRLDLICALAASVHGFCTEYDLDWSATWDLYRNGASKQDLRDCTQVWQAWNAGQMEWLIKRMERDVRAHYVREVGDR